MDEHHQSSLNARSFGAAAAQYARARPSYPLGAVEWLLPADARDVADVGAGTGLFTRRLVERGLHVVAVEPLPEMRAQLVSSLPDVEALDGSGEALPLPDASCDAVFFAQAWHWVDVARAGPEVARALRPGGALGLLWNVRDESVDWVARLGRIMHPGSEHEMFSANPTVGPPFQPIERRDFPWTHSINRDTLFDLVASRSYFIVLSAPERASVLDQVRDLLDTHPDLVGREDIEMPYITRCSRTTLA